MKDNIEKIYMGINKFQKNNKYMKLDKIMYPEPYTYRVLFL